MWTPNYFRQTRRNTSLSAIFLANGSPITHRWTTHPSNQRGQLGRDRHNQTHLPCESCGSTTEIYHSDWPQVPAIGSGPKQPDFTISHMPCFSLGICRSSLKRFRSPSSTCPELLPDLGESLLGAFRRGGPEGGDRRRRVDVDSSVVDVPPLSGQDRHQLEKAGPEVFVLVLVVDWRVQSPRHDRTPDMDLVFFSVSRSKERCFEICHWRQGSFLSSEEEDFTTPLETD